MTTEEFLGKCESEGIEYAFFDYGLDETDLDDDAPDELREAVTELARLAPEVRDLIATIEEYMEES